MFSIGFLTLDIIILIAIFLAFFFVSMVRGEYILARIILTFYPATIVFTYLPYYTPNGAIAEIGTYVVVYGVLYFLLAKHFTARRSYARGKKIFDASVLSIAAGISIAILYYHVLPLATLYSITLPFAQLFTETIPLGIWLCIPIVLLSLTNKDTHGV